MDLKYGELGWGSGGWFGQSGNESVTLCKNIWFPCRKGEKKHVRVQNAIRRLCAGTAGMTVISLFSIQIQGADEKRETQKLPQPPHPSFFFPSEHVTPTDSFCEWHSLEWEGEEALLCSTLSISHIISRKENVKGQTDWPLSLGKSTLHNANCTSAAITFPY